jgi:hypothetical protein
MRVHRFLILSLGVLLACPAEKQTDTAPVGDDTAVIPTLPQTVAGYRAEGAITWTLAFDEDAEAVGYVDCAYSRTYTGVEFFDQPYLCPECSEMVKGTAEMTEGFKDCYEPLFGGEAISTETWGFSRSDGAKAIGFYRSNSENLLMGELATLDTVVDGESFSLGWESEYELNKGGVMTLSAAGQGTLWFDETLEIEIRTARATPYLCGWPVNDPGTLATDYVLALDATFPTVALTDACEEELWLWDLYGAWLIIDTSQPDCGPCQTMASEMGAVLDAVREAGQEIYYVTLLGNGLSVPYQEPDSEVWLDWLTAFDDGEPILQDRGFGYATFSPYYADDFGYPAYAIVRPDMTVETVEKGWGTETAQEIIDLILKGS